MSKAAAPDQTANPAGDPDYREVAGPPPQHGDGDDGDRKRKQGRSGGHGRNRGGSVRQVTDRCVVNRDWLVEIAPYLPPAFGALLGLRWAKDQTHRQKAISFAFGVGVSVYFAPAIAEVLGHMPDKSPRIFAVISILTAMLGMDILAGVVAMSKAFASSPLSTFKDWWAAWKGR